MDRNDGAPGAGRLPEAQGASGNRTASVAQAGGNVVALPEKDDGEVVGVWPLLPLGEYVVQYRHHQTAVTFVERSDERARRQTVQEWLREYETGRPVEPAGKPAPAAIAPPPGPAPATPAVRLKYVSHRTTKPRKGRSTSSVVLAFANMATGEECVAFFQVSTSRQRGGGSYRTGVGGQFYPPPRSKFRAFWMAAVGRPPRRWSRVHKELHARLQDHTFTGKLTTKYRESTGATYTLISDLRVHNEGTSRAQGGHNECTRAA